MKLQKVEIKSNSNSTSTKENTRVRHFSPHVNDAFTRSSGIVSINKLGPRLPPGTADAHKNPRAAMKQAFFDERRRS